MLKADRPDTPGKANALARSRQYTDIRWTPLKDVPTHTNATGKTAHAAGVEVVGVPYSSPEPTDTFIWENYPVGTFLSAVENPNSALYTKDLKGRRNSWTYFGVVCNGLVRQALDIRPRYSTKRFMSIPGMTYVADAGSYRASDVRLCDILWVHSQQRSHTAFITGVFRDEAGEVRAIEVSEAVRPRCKRVTYGIEEYFEKYKLFNLVRYDFVDQTPPPEEILYPGKNRILGLDYGDRANYFSNRPVELSVFAEGPQLLSVTREGTPAELMEVTEKTVLDPEPGHYTVTHVETGDTVRFRICRPVIRYNVHDGCLSVSTDPGEPGSRLRHLDFREGGGPGGLPADVEFPCAAMAKIEELTEEEKRTGCFTRPIPETAFHFKVCFENEYGIYTHTMLPLYPNGKPEA